MRPLNTAYTKNPKPDLNHVESSVKSKVAATFTFQQILRNHSLPKTHHAYSARLGWSQLNLPTSRYSFVLLVRSLLRPLRRGVDVYVSCILLLLRLFATGVCSSWLVGMLLGTSMPASVFWCKGWLLGILSGTSTAVRSCVNDMSMGNISDGCVSGSRICETSVSLCKIQVENRLINWHDARCW